MQAGSVFVQNNVRFAFFEIIDESIEICSSN